MGSGQSSLSTHGRCGSPTRSLLPDSFSLYCLLFFSLFPPPLLSGLSILCQHTSCCKCFSSIAQPDSSLSPFSLLALPMNSVLSGAFSRQMATMVGQIREWQSWPVADPSRRLFFRTISLLDKYSSMNETKSCPGGAHNGTEKLFDFLTPGETTASEEHFSL